MVEELLIQFITLLIYSNIILAIISLVLITILVVILFKKNHISANSK